MRNNTEITKRSTDYSRWYLDVIAAAELAENSPVRGCMVIRPDGYALWENIQKILDAKFKATGVKNAYFPIFIPLSFLEKEAKHVEGFAKECAVVTHHRLEVGVDGKLAPASPLEEPLIIRPTSETIMYAMFTKWIRSYRDLPLLLNQWCNVVRWEMRTRLFLRTTEFLWQEGHTAHATKEEADERTRQMLEVYRVFAEEYLAIPVITGVKTETEKFAGADYTTCIEAMMQDGKALQAATSHMLGQNFAKSFNVKFLRKDSMEEFAWQTSWGLSTRIIGALIMAHSDDKGLILPPKIAPIHVVIIPIWKTEEEKNLVVAKANSIAKDICERLKLMVEIDISDDRLGSKFFAWERKGVPVRLEIGPKDLAQKSVMLFRRDTLDKVISKDEQILSDVQKTLNDMQSNLFQRAIEFRKNNTREINSWDEFKSIIEGTGGFLFAHWCESPKCEVAIQEQTKATIRCIPFDQKKEDGKCVLCGGHSSGRVIFAKSY